MCFHRSSTCFFYGTSSVDYATFIGFEILPSSDPDGAMLRDMCWFMGLSIVRAMYDESFSVYRAMLVKYLLHELRLPFKLQKNSLTGKIYQMSQAICRRSFRFEERPNAYIRGYILWRYRATNIHSLLRCPLLTISI